MADHASELTTWTWLPADETVFLELMTPRLPPKLINSGRAAAWFKYKIQAR
jgi:hypothetical protein